MTYDYIITKQTRTYFWTKITSVSA